MIGKSVVDKYENLLQHRLEMRGLWDDMEKYCVSFKGKYRGHSTDPYQIYDDTTFRSINILASGLYSYLTNPVSKWFILHNDSPQNLAAGKWASAATDVLLRVLRQSNFYQLLYGFYKNLINYGVAMLYEEGTPSGVRFMSVHPNNFVFRKNVWDELEEVIIELGMSADELVNIYGTKKVSDEVLKAYEGKENRRFTVLFYVGRSYNKKSKFAYDSLWVEKETDNVLRESGYNEMPFFLAQWYSDVGSVYSSSPSIDALPTIKLANRITKIFWLHNEKKSSPPLDVPYDGYEGDIDLSPGAINYRMTSNPQDKILPIITTGDINITMESLQAAQQQIEERYYVDLFLMMKQTTMTATEVIQRNQEKLLLLGAVIGRLTHDVLVPLVKRTLNLCIDEGLISPMDSEIKVEFLSPLAQTQKSAEYSSMVVLLNTVLQVAQFDGEVVDVVNWDEFIRKVGDIYSVDNRLFIDEDTVQQIRQQRAQLEQEKLRVALQTENAKAMKQQAQAQLTMRKSEGLV